MRSSLYRVGLPSREHARGRAVMAVVVVNAAGCASESSIGEWLRMRNTATRILMGKPFQAVTVYVG